MYTTCLDDIHIPFVSLYFCRSIGVMACWNTPKKACTVVIPLGLSHALVQKTWAHAQGYCKSGSGGGESKKKIRDIWSRSKSLIISKFLGAPGWGRQKGVTPICSDFPFFFRCLPICVSCLWEYHDLFLFVLGIPRFLPICFQNNAEQTSETPDSFCKSPNFWKSLKTSQNL